jgi:hypothetical protein
LFGGLKSGRANGGKSFMAKPPGKQEITKDDIEGWSASKAVILRTPERHSLAHRGGK